MSTEVKTQTASRPRLFGSNVPAGMDEPGEDDEGEGVEGHGWKKRSLNAKSRSACGLLRLKIFCQETRS